MKGKLMHALMLLGAVCVLSLTGCSSKTAINFNVHTEPEGAHVVYQQDGSPWIYLGVTPLDAIEVMSGEQLEAEDTVTLRVMRCGYMEQAKEWSGEELEKENQTKGQIFWTPRLIKATE